MGGGKPHRRPRMKDIGTGKPHRDPWVEPRPRQPTSRTSSPKRAKPQPDDLRPKLLQARPVARHRVVVVPSPHYPLKPPSDLRRWIVPPKPQLLFHLLQL